MNWEKAFVRCFNTVVFCLFSAFIVLFFFNLNARAETRRLTDISLHDTQGGFQIKITGDGPVEDYHLYYFAEPWRMVIDIPGKWDYPGDSVFRLSNDTVKYIIVGEHPEKMRIVTHLKGKSVISPYIDKTPNGLILTVKRSNTVSVEKPVESRKGGKRVLKEIRTGEDEDGFVADIITGESISSHERFFILDEDPKKFVLDLPGNWEVSMAPVVETDGGLVRRIRLGSHRDF